MKLTHILLTSTAIASASLAYGQTISSTTTDEVNIDLTDTDLTITDAGSVTVNPLSPLVSTTNAITINSGVVATVQNNGVINITYTEEDITGVYSLNNSINGIMDTDSASVINNNGIIQTNLSLTGGNAYSYAYTNANNSGNGVYGNVETNEGFIQTNLSLTGGSSSAYTDANAAAIAQNSGNGIYGNVEINEGIIQTNLSLTGGDADADANADANAVIDAHASASASTNSYAGANNSGNGVLGNVETNEGIIQTNLSLTGGDTYAYASASASAYTDVDADADAFAYYSGNGVYGNVETNEGIIQTNLSLTGGNASAYASASTNAYVYTNAYAYTNTNAHAFAYYSGNGVYGNVETNEGIIQTNLSLTGGNASAYASASTNAYVYTNAYAYTNTNAHAFAYYSGNGVLGNVETNEGIIQTNLSLTGGDTYADANADANAVIDAHASASASTNSYAGANNSGNGVLGNVETNEGIIQTNLSLTGGDTYAYASASASASAYTDVDADADAFASYSGNGVYGNLGTNNGTIAAYLSLTAGKENGVTSTTSNFYSGNGVVLTDSSTETAMNTGSIIASSYAIAATTARNATNYGTLVGTNIYNSNVIATNYGTEILIDADGNVLSIDNTGASATIDGKTSEQASLQQGDLDSYNIYTSETEITNKIINGAGVASGVVTLQDTADFTITNSSLNAYHTALDIQTTNRVDASDTYFNGGGLQGEYAVIKGDAQDNILLVHGASYINGDVALGDGADIFVLDIDNVQLNGTADLGAADDDTFALYTFNGTGAELTTATEDYASWGMFNEYMGDKVLNFENIGAEIGTINMTDDLTAYGLYVGSQATANFITNDEYALKNLRNDGIVNMSDDTAVGHITVGDYLKGTGTYIFDTDFATLESDYITVNGQVTANGTIAINDITSADGTQSAGTHEILLIEAPNDSDKSDEDFNLADANQYNNDSKQGRFTGSPYVWALANSGNDWVLTTTIPGNPEPPKPPVVAEIPAYTSLPTIGREMVMDELGTLHTRLGELRNNQGWVGTGDSNLKTNLGSEWHNAIGFDDSKANAWLKGTISHFDISSDNSFDVSGTYGGFNLGIDKKFDLGNSSPDWSVFTGLFGGYKTGSFETSGKGNQYTSNEHADIDIDAWSIGGYATFFNTAGTYIDLVAEYMDFSADIDAAGLNSSTDGYALAGSIEVGHSFDLAKDWIIEPQAQVKLAHINWDDFNDSVNDVSFEDHTYITGRAGVRVEKNIETSYGEIKPWAYMGVLHEFTDAPEVTYANTIFEAVDYNTAGEIKLGITADIYKSTQLYSDIGYTTDFGDYNSVKGDLGLRLQW